jgi:hypothetical protein
MENKFETINGIINSLEKLEEKGCHRIFFEYGSNSFTVSIYRGEIKLENTVLKSSFNVENKQALNELQRLIDNLQIRVCNTVFQCYKRTFEKGVTAGEWEKTVSNFEVGENATQAMLADGRGYYINDPDNRLQYYVDMTKESETKGVKQ